MLSFDQKYHAQKHDVAKYRIGKFDVLRSNPAQAATFEAAFTRTSQDESPRVKSIHPSRDVQNHAKLSWKRTHRSKVNIGLTATVPFGPEPGNLKPDT